VIARRQVRQVQLRLFDEIIVDSFAGGGGASMGIELALGRSPDIAINHDPEAIAVHAANHPGTKHFIESIYKVVPKKACRGRKVGLAWFSPDCKHFSKAKGAVPVSKHVRGLAWQVVRWAKDVHPRVIVLENVEEFEGWGPLLKRTVRGVGKKGTPDPRRKGDTFKRWLRDLRAQGYVVEWKQLKACDYGAPTTRKRLFVIARNDGQAITWPEPTHGPGRAQPWKIAADCISWERECPSIFERKKALAKNTLRRIARGVQRYVIDAASPFIVPVTHTGDARIHGVDDPLPTITAAKRGELALVEPTLVAGSMIQRGWGERSGVHGEQAPRCLDIQAPMGTIVAGGIKQAAVYAFLAKHNAGHEATGQKLTAPVSTITSKDSKALVTAAVSFLSKYRGTSTGSPTDAPMPTITANGKGGGHLAEVRAFLIAYYGTAQHTPVTDPMHTITTKERFAMVEVAGVDHAIVDIGMRMLEARELYRGQGFPEDYVIDPLYNGKTLTKTAQVRCVGNSVCPPLAAAIVRANYEAPALAQSA
jgi:DNA (cytosine-5)-methyltransferase 1